MTLPSLIAAIILSVSGHAVPSSCQTGLASSDAYGLFSEGQGVMEAAPAGPTGVQNIVAVYPDQHIFIDAGLCRALTTLIADPSAARHYAHPGARDWYQAAALMAVLHEAEHANQFANDQPLDDVQAQLVAMNELASWLQRIGVPPARISRLVRVAGVINAESLLLAN